jgi:hypothetical protein
MMREQLEGFGFGVYAKPLAELIDKLRVQAYQPPPVKKESYKHALFRYQENLKTVCRNDLRDFLCGLGCGLVGMVVLVAILLLRTLLLEIGNSTRSILAVIPLETCTENRHIVLLLVV